MPRNVDVGEFVMITKKNDNFFGKIGIVSDQDGDNWFVTFPGWRYTEIYKKSNLKVITKNVVISVVTRGGKLR